MVDLSGFVLVPREAIPLLQGLLEGELNTVPNANPPRRWYECHWCASTMPDHENGCAVEKYQEAAHPSSCDALLQAMGEVIEAAEKFRRDPWSKARRIALWDVLSRYDAAKGKMMGKEDPS